MDPRGFIATIILTIVVVMGIVMVHQVHGCTDAGGDFRQNTVWYSCEKG